MFVRGVMKGKQQVPIVNFFLMIVVYPDTLDRRSELKGTNFYTVKIMHNLQTVDYGD